MKPRTVNKPKSNIKKSKTNGILKKAAIIGLSATIAAGVGYKAANSKPIRSFNYNRNINSAHRMLDSVKTVGEQLSDLNRSKANREKGIIYAFDGVRIRKVVVDPKKIETILTNQIKNYKLMESRLEIKVNELNKSGKAGEIYYWNGEKISKISLDLVKLNNIAGHLSAESVLQINSLIDEIVKSRVENKDANIKNEFYTKVVNRMKKADAESFRKYFLTLPYEAFVEEIRSNNPKHLQEMEKIVKRINPKVLNYVEKESKIDASVAGSSVVLFKWLLFSTMYKAIKRPNNSKPKKKRSLK